MRIILLLLVTVFSSTVFATEISSATIKRLMLDRSMTGKVFVSLDKHQTNSVACHTLAHWEFVLDISDDFGKALYSSLLSLQASGRSALFRGDDACSLYPQIETLRRIELK